MNERADKILFQRGLVTSRSQAKVLIEKGDVLCNGLKLKKAGELIDSNSEIEIQGQQYVGRGAFKLTEALRTFSIEVTHKVFLDVGASTGGFTEVLLNAGAQRVYAIDVGHGQLAHKLLIDDRVINLEKTNIKDLNSLPELADGAVMDLSFISITKVLHNVRTLMKKGAPLIALVKPQFEAGLERLPKDGVIKDAAVQKQVLEEVVLFAQANGWEHLKSITSPIDGKSGNKEFLSHFKKL